MRQEAIFAKPPKQKSVDELFDHPDEPEEAKSEDFSALHFERIQKFPPLTKAEQQDLLELWCNFRDEKAKDRIAKAHLRMVPPIARNTARKFGFEPFWETLPAGTKRDAFTGYQEVVSELTAEGNLALVNALEHYDLSSGYVFYTYARTCVSNAIMRRAKSLRSAVDRPYGRPAPWDLSTLPTKPDPQDFRDYVGSRANRTVNDDPEDDGANTSASHSRLRASPPEPRIIFGDSPSRYDGQWRAGLMGLDSPRSYSDELTDEERRVIDARMSGLKLKEIANDLGMSIATAWRREKQAVHKLARIETA